MEKIEIKLSGKGELCRHVKKVNVNFMKESLRADRYPSWRRFCGMQLWHTRISPLRTLSGLEFSYTVKHKKNGEYSGELLVSRKETSKTLTRSSVMLAFHKVLEQIEVTEKDGTVLFTPPSYKGPKAIGPIFGISYIFSLFLALGLIKTADRNIRKDNQI